jgi:glycosyltransferase involved in cell wall biosynthesis
MYDEIKHRVASLGLIEKIRLPGVTTDVWAALAAMDVFALTSRMEGLPNVLIEAQGAGVPVVCTAVGGMPETYLDERSGIGVPSAKPQDLADAILRLLDDSGLRSSMSAEAVAFARSEFNTAHMIERTLALYRRITHLAPPFHPKPLI